MPGQQYNFSKTLIDDNYQFTLKYLIFTGFVGPTPRYTPIDCRPVHVHKRPEVPSHTLATDRRLDTTNTVPTDQR